MSKQKRGLGRGLGALLNTPTASVAETDAAGVRSVAVDQIAPNPEQPRQRFDEAQLAELAESIRANGLIQPLIVTRAPANMPVPFMLIAGERRWRAARLAGIEELPVIVREATQRQLLEWAVIENVQRADLNPLEEAAAYKSLMEQFNLKQGEIAAQVGKSRVSIANTIRLLNLNSACQAALLDGSISEGHGRALLGLEDASLQDGLLAQIIKKRLSVRQTEALVRDVNAAGQRRSRKVPESDPETEALQELLQSALGTKVQLQRGKKGGRVVIHFYSDEELQAIYDRIVGPRG